MQHRIRIYGIVQGIGFRPFVKRLADRYGIVGDVCNRGSCVEIHASGNDAAMADFEAHLESEMPPAGSIVQMERAAWEAPSSVDSFVILESVSETGLRFVSPDLAICPDCERELFDPHDRRYLHPFINCTNCGPRLTILDSMPYDRVRTSMRDFPMCPDCEYEYTHPETRRYHAQPVCCREDGPSLEVITTATTAAYTDLTWSDEEEQRARDDRAVELVRDVLRNGGIAAIKGIGGFHLACDAGNETAVRRLRALKHRPTKPFAVMMKDLAAVKRYCSVPPEAEPILCGSQKPILLLEKKDFPKFHTSKSEKRGLNFDTALAASVAPFNPTIGVMLPYAPIQLLLFRYPDGFPFPDALVMTSGNPGGAPIARTTEEASEYLSGMCDVILTNDREIRLRADDSVMQLIDGKPSMLRRSRGYAPLPVTDASRDFDPSHLQVLAIGGELKNTFVLGKDGLYYPSPYVGDLADRRSVEALESGIERMKRLLETEPEVVVCDLHPRYRSSECARDYAAAHGIKCLEVQHHFAHIRACAAEHDAWQECVIGVAFDGTGYGTDGTVWGGEFLIAEPDHFVRVGSLAPFLQSGGDAASKEGWRIAAALLADACSEEAAEVTDRLGVCTDLERTILMQMQSTGMNTVESTSAGRMFDAAAAILGICRSSGFEGEASMALQFAAEAAAQTDGLSGSELISPVLEAYEERDEVKVRGCGSSRREFLVSFLPVIRDLAEERLDGTRSVEALALAFHQAVAQGILEGCRASRRMSGIQTVALSGGVFQNRLLLTLAKHALEQDGFTVLTHSMIPANDGGIALGQAAIAAAILTERNGD